MWKCLLEWNFILLIVTLLNAYSYAQIGGTCNNEQGICSYIYQCPPVMIDFNNLFKNNKIVYCNRDNSIVCCPKKRTTKTPIHKDSALLTACSNYYTEAYEGKCQPLPFIVNGNRAESKEFPHMALLGYKSRQDEISWFCGGTLISKTFVITAAHCVQSSTPVNIVRLGELDYSRTDDDTETQDFEVKKFILHPAYEGRSNDIALLQLNGEAKISAYVVPACLPLLDNKPDYQKFLATGWGAVGFFKNNSPHLLKVQLERYATRACNVADNSQQINEQSIICAGSKTDNRDTCQGDSGGPLFVEHPVYRCMYLLLGVTSYGDYGCGGFKQNRPAVYQRVAFFTDWIKSIIHTN